MDGLERSCASRCRRVLLEEEEGRWDLDAARLRPSSAYKPAREGRAGSGRGIAGDGMYVPLSYDV